MLNFSRDIFGYMPDRKNFVNLKDVTVEESHQALDAYGIDYISGAEEIPTFGNYDPLAQIASNTKKQIRKQFQVGVSILIEHCESGTRIRFNLDWAYYESHCPGLPQRLYVSRFIDTFELMTSMYDECILEWFEILGSSHRTIINSDVDTPTKLKILHDTTHHFLVNSGRKEKNRAERKSEAEKAPHARHRKKAENPLFDQDS